MWVLGAFLVFISAAATKTATEKNNATRAKKEVAKVERQERKAFEKMMKTSDRMAREGE